jgi:DNA-binding transcriptional ArsR family regulator
VEEKKMSKAEITNKDIYEKLEDIRKLISTQVILFKLINSKAIEDARDEILKLAIRKKVFDLCDNKRTVTKIAQELFQGDPVEKSQPKVSYHLAILEEYGLVAHRDEKGVRYYFKTRE